MTTLLGRQLTETEEGLRDALAKLPIEKLRRSSGKSGTGQLEMRNDFFAPALALIQVPVKPGWQRELCEFLLAQPGFLTYLAEPDQFNESDLSRICRVLIEVDEMMDVKLARALQLLHERNHGSDGGTVVRLLGVLDKISPGRRVVMSVIHLLREVDPAAASKAALFLGKRVQNPDWVRRQMSSADPRVRANLIESLWNLKSTSALKSFQEALLDGHNRVVGNALVGLHLLGDSSVPKEVRSMLRHSDPRYRATAAWVMGKIAAPGFRDDLTAALHDESDAVRKSVMGALELLPPQPQAPEGPAVEIAAARPAPEDLAGVAVAGEPPAPEDSSPSRSFIPFVKS